MSLTQKELADKRNKIESQKPGDFTYGDYVVSNDVTNKKNAYEQYLTKNPGDFMYANQAQYDDIMNQYMNRDKFSYDLNGDALYQQYKNQFNQQGKMASMDVMGQAAAMTGGYGNSYAQSVGQQAYQSYLQQLNDKIPELYQLAMDKYNMEGQDLYNKYAMMTDDWNRVYGMHRDAVSDFKDERKFLYDDYINTSETDYNRYLDRENMRRDEHQSALDIWQSELDRADNEYWKQTEYDYQVGRDKVADEQWQKTFDEGVRQFDKSVEISSGGSGSGSGGSGGDSGNSGNKVGYDNGGVDVGIIKAMQSALGVEPDGKWGPETQAAAKEKWGTASAAEAQKKYQQGDKPTYASIKKDLDSFIAGGADKSKISNYIRSAVNAGYITQNQAQQLLKVYSPRGYTY